MDTDRILTMLTTSPIASDRVEAARALADTPESSELLVRALLDARDTDPDPAVREEAARALGAPAHQAVMRRSVVLAMRNQTGADASGALSFEAREEGASPDGESRRWIVEISAGQALFTAEGTDEKIAVEIGDAGQTIQDEPAGAEEATGQPSLKRRIRMQDRVFTLTPMAYLKLREWMDKAPPPPAPPARRTIPRVAWGLIALGAVQLVFPTVLSPFWGAVWILLGAANIIAPPRKLDLVNALAVMMAGTWYILFAEDWAKLIGYLPGIWGTLRLFDYFRNR
jgi:hypothetical protein